MVLPLFPAITCFFVHCTSINKGKVQKEQYLRSKKNKNSGKKSTQSKGKDCREKGKRRAELHQPVNKEAINNHRVKREEVRSNSAAKSRTFESFPLTLLFQGTSHIFSEGMHRCQTSHPCHAEWITMMVSLSIVIKPHACRIPFSQTS